MHDVCFEIGERDDPVDGIVEAVGIFVDGRDLMEVVREIESPFAARDGQPDLAGTYVGLPPEEIFTPSRRQLGEPETRYDGNAPWARSRCSAAPAANQVAGPCW